MKNTIYTHTQSPMRTRNESPDRTNSIESPTRVGTHQRSHSISLNLSAHPTIITSIAADFKNEWNTQIAQFQNLRSELHGNKTVKGNTRTSGFDAEGIPRSHNSQVQMSVGLRQILDGRIHYHNTFKKHEDGRKYSPGRAPRKLSPVEAAQKRSSPKTLSPLNYDRARFGKNKRGSDITYQLGASHLQTASHFRRVGAKQVGQEYNAFAKTTYMSPNQQRKTRGFVSFDLQTFRPTLARGACHDRRFEAFNTNPKIGSDHKPNRLISFDKVMGRDNLCYRDTRCSDPLYEHQRHLNLTHKKGQGILDFGRSVVDRYVEERMWARMKEYKKEDKPNQSFLDKLNLDNAKF